MSSNAAHLGNMDDTTATHTNAIGYISDTTAGTSPVHPSNRGTKGGDNNVSYDDTVEMKDVSAGGAGGDSVFIAVAADGTTTTAHEPAHQSSSDTAAVTIPSSSAAAVATTSKKQHKRTSTKKTKEPTAAASEEDVKPLEGLVIYVAPKCPFCMRVKGLFTAFGVTPTLIDTTLPENKADYEAKVKAFEHYTVPLVMYKDKLIGGCDDVCALIERGELPRWLDLPINHAAPRPATQPRRDIVSPCLFNFPPLVDNRLVRMTGLLTMIMSIILIVFRKDEWAWWVSFGMALDFVVRFMFGGTGSVLGSLAVAIVSPMDEELVPGPPKQFAAFVGVCFYTAICATFLGGDGAYGTEIAASILLGIIAFFAFLESFFNFCAGCFVFGYLVAFGIVRDTIYQPYTDSYEYTNYAVTEWNAKNGWVDSNGTAKKKKSKNNNAAVADADVEGESDDDDGPLAIEGEEAALNPKSIGWRRKWLVDDKFRPAHKPVVRQIKVSEAHHHNGSEQTTVVDIHYKFPKTEETSREKWSVYKYISLADFASCMGTAGFAMMVKNATHTFWLPETMWIFFSLLAAVHYALFIIALFFKTVFYPKKVFMEFQNPMKRNAGGIIPIVIAIFGLLVRDESHVLALVLFWIACPLIVINLIVQMAYLIKNRHGMSAFTPTNLIAPLGLFVLSILTANLARQMDHKDNAAWALEASKFFWGAALLFFLILFAASVYVGVLFHWGPDKMRPAIVIWMGASFITTSSYLMIFNPPTLDSFFYVFFGSGIVLYLTILYLIFPGNWLLRGRFDMANWGASFPLSVFGVAATLYYSHQRHPFAHALCWIAYTSSGFANFLCFFHTIRLLVQRKWPGPHPECSPMMFNKFVADALVELSARLKAEALFNPTDDKKTTDAADEANADNANTNANTNTTSAVAFSPNSDARLLELTAYYLSVLKTVIQYNLDIVLPEFIAVNPRQAKVSIGHHQWSLEAIAALTSLVEEGNVAKLRADLPSIIDTQYDYFMWMQDHLAPLMHKGMNQRIGMLVLERIWERVDKEELQAVVSMTFRYASKQMYRTMFLKTVTSALPERCQQIGRWLFIDAVKDPLGDIKLSMMYDDIPEIIPKGMGITWTRQM